MTLASLLWLLLLLPIGGLVVGLSGGKAGNGWMGPLACVLTALGLLGTGYLAWQLAPAGSFQLAYDWISVGTRAPVAFGFWVDDLTLRMLGLVFGIGLLVQIFSLEYLRHDPAKSRYFAFLQGFLFSMIGLVLADNLLTLYLFWELVGLSSYLLIGFWTGKPEAARAAKKAFLVNRLGDVGLLLGLFGVYAEAGNFQFSIFNSQFSTITGLLLCCGVLGKSAQFPLHVWLPDAMEGPTPVSALIHAATMVAAGVYLLARIFPALSPEVLLFLTVIGGITTLLGGVYALVQTDIKRTLAYSTISQLGLMVLGVGLGGPGAAIFHLTTHAFFKAGLFLAAGSVIHALHHGTPSEASRTGFDAQDLRQMGGLRKALPWTFGTFLVCAAGLAGVPLTAGFFSKDDLLGTAWTYAGPGGWFWTVLILVSGTLTACYAARQTYLIFFGTYRGTVVPFHVLYENPRTMTVPLAILTLGSVALAVVPNPLATEYPHLAVGVASVSALALGLALAYGLARRGRLLTPPAIPTLDELYRRAFIAPTRYLTGATNWIDLKILDGLVDGTARANVLLGKVVTWIDRVVIDGLISVLAQAAGTLGAAFRTLQTGRVQGYVAAAVAALIGFLVWLAN
jgi:NADH-quinone oxidoreductase subunit L